MKMFVLCTHLLGPSHAPEEALQGPRQMEKGVNGELRPHLSVADKDRELGVGCL